MGRTREVMVELTELTCCQCGCLFAVTDGHYRSLLAQGATWYCPNGHAQHFIEPWEARLKAANAKLAAEQATSKQVRAWYDAEQRDHEHTRKRLAAQKGALTRTKNRIANGVCPCCNRTFANLARHMAGQHPEYAADDGAT